MKFTLETVICYFNYEFLIFDLFIHDILGCPAPQFNNNQKSYFHFQAGLTHDWFMSACFLTTWLKQFILSPETEEFIDSNQTPSNFQSVRIDNTTRSFFILWARQAHSLSAHFTSLFFFLFSLNLVFLNVSVKNPKCISQVFYMYMQVGRQVHTNYIIQM